MALREKLGEYRRSRHLQRGGGKRVRVGGRCFPSPRNGLLSTISVEIVGRGCRDKFGACLGQISDVEHPNVRETIFSTLDLDCTSSTTSSLTLSIPPSLAHRPTFHRVIASPKRTERGQRGGERRNEPANGNDHAVPDIHRVDSALPVDKWIKRTGRFPRKGGAGHANLTAKLN